jgi:SPP1 gp7 family putative phage head morphogenesis protein
MPDLLFGPVPADDAIDFIKSKPVVSRQVFNILLPELKARAFCVSGIENVNVLQRVRDKLATLPAGARWDDVKKDVLTDISPYLVDDSAEPEERDQQIASASRRAELLLRTHGFQAYQAAAFDVAERNRATHPYFQYVSMEDERVRPSHAALDGVILPQDSSFWRDHYPPWDWGCRCRAVPISQDDFDDAKKADAKLPADDRMILDGARQVELETSGNLVRGPNKIVNCASPVAMGKPGAFAWNPGTLQLPLGQLQARYAPDVWQTFSTWAQRTELSAEDGRTVWAWLNGGPAMPKPEPPVVARLVESVAAPAPAVVLPPAAAPVPVVAPPPTQPPAAFQTIIQSIFAQEPDTPGAPTPLPPWNAPKFANERAATAWADANMHPTAGLFSRDQLDALADYQGAGYRTINQELRNWRGNGVPSAISKDVAKLDAAMAASQTPEDLTVFRGLDYGVVRHLGVGDYFEEKAYASTSLSADVAENEFGGGAVMEIRLPSGSSAVYLDGLDPAMANEIEVLMARGTPLRCLKREVRGGVLWLTMEAG